MSSTWRWIIGIILSAVGAVALALGLWILTDVKGSIAQVAHKVDGVQQEMSAVKVDVAQIKTAVNLHTQLQHGNKGERKGP